MKINFIILGIQIIDHEVIYYMDVIFEISNCVY